MCQPQNQHRTPSEKTASLTVTAPDAFLITEFCVKAGSIKQGDGPEFNPVEPHASSVVLSRSSEKNISHYVLYLTPIPEEPPPPPPVDLPAPTTGPEFTPPSCLAAGSFVAPASTEGLEYTTTNENGVIAISVIAKPGFVLSGETGPWTKAVSDLAQLTGEACGTEVDSAGPVPPTTPPAQAVRTEATPAQASPPGDPAPASLPATGLSSWALAGAALAALAAGLFLTRLSRRPDEQTA